MADSDVYPITAGGFEAFLGGLVLESDDESDNDVVSVSSNDEDEYVEALIDDGLDDWDDRPVVDDVSLQPGEDSSLETCNACKSYESDEDDDEIIGGDEPLAEEFGESESEAEPDDESVEYEAETLAAEFGESDDDNTEPVESESEPLAEEFGNPEAETLAAEPVESDTEPLVEGDGDWVIKPTDDDNTEPETLAAEFGEVDMKPRSNNLEPEPVELSDEPPTEEPEPEVSGGAEITGGFDGALSAYLS